MRRAALATIAVTAAFVPFAGSAGAKGVSQVAICGAQGCKDVTNRAGDNNLAFPMGKKTHPPGTSAAFVRVVTVISEPSGAAAGTEEVVARSSYLYVPSLHLIRTQRRTQGATGIQMKAVWQRADPLLVQSLGELLYGFPRFAPVRLDHLRFSPPVKLPEKLGSHATVAATTGLATPPQAVKDTHDSGGVPWWAIVAGLALAAAGAVMVFRRGSTEPHAT